MNIFGQLNPIKDTQHISNAMQCNEIQGKCHRTQAQPATTQQYGYGYLIFISYISRAKEKYTFMHTREKYEGMSRQKKWRYGDFASYITHICTVQIESRVNFMHSAVKEKSKFFFRSEIVEVEYAVENIFSSIRNVSISKNKLYFRP